MALLKRKMITWLLRSLVALTLAIATLAGVTSLAFAHDDDNNNDVVIYGPNACTVITDLPAYPSATCVKHTREIDDGVTEIKNSYVTQAAADTVRQAFEATFGQQGWTVTQNEYELDEPQWEYTLAKTGRKVEVKIEAQDPDEGPGTAFSITER